MKFRFRIPRFATSTIESAQQNATPVYDGHDVKVANRWQIAPHTVALVGRPAVWFSIDITVPALKLGRLTVPAKRLVWEQDFGGHLFLAITGADNAQVTIIEAGPANPDGSGGLVPYDYPEDAFAQRGIVDFEPIVIPPPNGLSEEFFAELVRTTQRAYDGDQRYLAVEIPFLRIGRDSNSYAVGVLLCCGIDPREIPKPVKAMRWEYFGYPGVEDPVHRSNFGSYIGAPSRLAKGLVDVGFHNADGSVRHVLVGGEPDARVRLPDGEEVQLDRHGRIAFSPDDAGRHHLPSTHTPPPKQIVGRRHFPKDPSPAGDEITLIVADRAVPLEPGATYRGTIVERLDSVSIVRLRTSGADVVLPIVELGAELRDPKRVDRLCRVGNDVTIGLDRDRHPKLVVHGGNWLRDRIRWRRLHAPRPVNIAGTVIAGAVVLTVGLGWWLRSR